MKQKFVNKKPISLTPSTAKGRGFEYICDINACDANIPGFIQCVQSYEGIFSEAKEQHTDQQQYGLYFPLANLSCALFKDITRFSWVNLKEYNKRKIATIQTQWNMLSL